MEIGVIFPQTEIGADVGAIRDYAQATEDLGFAHIFIADHVLGADTQFHTHPSLANYSQHSVVHESLTLMGYLAAITEKVGLVTGILILPQRQTVLVAKQAAEIDVLSGGRLRLGIGVGWNQVEFEALGQDFHDRGRRSAEQIEVLRALWTQEVVDFHGRWHNITHAGLNPLPVQRPIPIWLGGGGAGDSPLNEVVLRRIGRLADGWFPMLPPNQEGKEAIDRVRRYAEDAGRDPDSVGLEGRVTVAAGGPEDWAGELKAWSELGATHISVNTGGAGFTTPDEHIDAIRRVKEVIGG